MTQKVALNKYHALGHAERVAEEGLRKPNLERPK
jgi:hypothetical protein